MYVFCAGLFVLQWPVATTVAQELLGAKAALQQIRNEPEKPDAKEEASGFEKTIRELPKKIEVLAPADAAAAWIAAYDEWQAAEQQSRSGHRQVESTFSDLVNALPAPEAWPDLVRLIEARPVEGSPQNRMRAIGLRMFVHRLVQSDQLKQDVDQAMKLVETPKKTAKKPGLVGIVGNVFGNSGQPDYWKEDMLQSVLAVKTELDPKSAVEQFRSQLESEESVHQGYLTVPDLVQLVGREEATPLLEKVLLLKNGVVTFDLDNEFQIHESETIKLARELARKHLKELKQPHWQLCHSIDTDDLFEAFAAMPVEDNQQMDHSGGNDEVASLWYIMGLIIRDRTQEVVKFLIASQGDEKRRRQDSIPYQLSYSILPQLERAGHAKKVHEFLAEVLKTHPELPLWEIFVQVSARRGQSKQVLVMVDRALAKQNLPAETRRHLERIQIKALLAADQIDDGVAETLKLLAEEEKDDDQNHARSNVHTALDVAKIGHLLERDEWVRQGTDIAEDRLKKETGSDNLDSLVGFLIDVKQWARAERLVISALTKQLEIEKLQPAGMRHRLSARYWLARNASPLENLLQVYHAAARPADAVTLLEDAPWWRQTDIADMLNTYSSPSSSHGERPGMPVPLIAARSLATVGRKDEARRIATAMIFYWPGFDPGWQLALELTGDDFPPLAEQVFARDHFQERPLIWLAKFHLDRGNLVKAEEFARQAIAIDPSDGEQGRGDRMRVYGILAEILKSKDAKTAAIYEGAVKAIRLAEQADQFYSAGMLSRGIRMYRASLKLFADAYCIQSRLAVQLAEEGDLDGAAEHYQRAFELMPDSFGRVESHCFGCEGVFNGPLAETVADRVFTKLVADQPNNPRVHYLLGYLRETESRHRDAAKSFREAVRLDPDYLNAWQKLLDSKLSGDEHDNAVFEIMRLDPGSKHSHADISKVQDLSRLWKVLHDNVRRVPDLERKPLFELKAAKSAQVENHDENDFFPVQIYGDRQLTFSSQGTLTSIANLIENASQ